VLASQRTSIGVIGGLGPLASAEFLKTIYECNLRGLEQESPTVLMYSDPSFPDRTEAFLAGKPDVLLARLTAALNHLCEAGVSKIVICCMTIHYLLPSLPPHLRSQIVSLLDVIFENITDNPRPRLLICSSGTQHLRLFQNHQGWDAVKDHVVLPDEADQHWIHHELIYQVKKNRDIREFIPQVKLLLKKYEVDSFIAGCSEIHLLAKQFTASTEGQNGYGCIDPLTIIATQLMEDQR